MPTGHGAVHSPRSPALSRAHPAASGDGSLRVACPAMNTKLTLEYDGGEFAGWARQPGLRTVQEEVERALRTILGERGADGQPLALTVAGRTDRGVHAWGQVASYAHEAVDPARLNALLPPDVAVLAAEPAPEGFDARRDARSRTYCYRVLARRARGVFTRASVLWWPQPVDREALDACANVLTGTHDFTAFTPTETDHVRFERDVWAAEWRSLPAPVGEGGPAGEGGRPARGGRPAEGRGQRCPPRRLPSTRARLWRATCWSFGSRPTRSCAT